MVRSWEQLHDEVEACQKCRLCEARTRVVLGEGNPHARLMLIGEGPGRDEDQQGRPFVGASGQLLMRMLHAIGMERSEVYIANIVKCRPPGNRNPEADEASACLPYLRAQVALVRPSVIALLGRVAVQYTLNDSTPIGRLHGRWIVRKNVWFMPTYHPSALLRDPSHKREAWADFVQIRDRLAEVQQDE